MTTLIAKTKIIVFIPVLLFTFGCQMGKEVHQETISNPAGGGANRGQSAGLPDLNSNGGSHTGGGNGIERASLEDFRKNIVELTEYKNHVLPLIQKISKKVPNLAADLIHIATERSWHFVPVELNALPASQIGVGFRTDQLAIHKQKSIWISTVHYDEMNESKKATLLMHELIMGVRLLDFQDKLDQCLARTVLLGLEGTAQAQRIMSEARSKCFSSISNRLDRGHEMRLGDPEHDDIRDLTEKLINNIDNMDANEITGWIKAKNFRHWD